MLDNMFIGRPPGNYDRLLDFSRAVTGTLFFVPSATFLDDVAADARAPIVPLDPARRHRDSAAIARRFTRYWLIERRLDMNNLHRELAPISDAAWAQIEDEASRTLKRHLAARRVVDVVGPEGFRTLRRRHRPSAADRRLRARASRSAQREAKALVELRVPFELTRQAIDDVERGATDSDWAPLKEAARKIAFAEDRAVFDGYAAAGIQGIRKAASNPAVTLPASVAGYPDAVAQAVSRCVLPASTAPMRWCSARTPIPPRAAAATRDIRSSTISSAWSTRTSSGRRPSKAGSSSTRGGDFELDIGQDLSIGYLEHSEHERRALSAGDIHLPAADVRGLRYARAVAKVNAKS